MVYLTLVVLLVAMINGKTLRQWIGIISATQEGTTNTRVRDITQLLVILLVLLDTVISAGFRTARSASRASSRGNYGTTRSVMDI